MQTKLTLSIEQSLIEQAKQYAKARGQSLSQVIEQYLRSVTHQTETGKETDAVSPTVQSMRGAFKEPKGFDYERELSDALAEKYLRP